MASIDAEQVESIKILHNHPETDINAAPSLESALSLAVYKDLTEISKLLLSHLKIDVNFLNPLTDASSKGNYEIVRIMLDHPDIQPEKELMIQACCKTGMTDIADIVLELDVDLDRSMDPEYPSLIIAIENNLVDIVDRLLAKGANPNITTTNDRTALMFASKIASLGIVDRLLAHGADVLKVDKFGTNAAMYACKECREDVLSRLLTMGIDVNAVDEDGTTLLMMCTQRRRLDLVKLVLSFGADPDLKDVHGRPALYYALCDEVRQHLQGLKQGTDDVDQTEKQQEEA